MEEAPFSLKNSCTQSRCSYSWAYLDLYSFCESSKQQSLYAALLSDTPAEGSTRPAHRVSQTRSCLWKFRLRIMNPRTELSEATRL